MHSHKEAAAASAPVAEQAPPLDVRSNENALAAGVESKRKRGKSYDDRQMAIMVAAIRNGSEYKQILKENKDSGFTLYGLKDAVKRLKANDMDPARKQGSGRKASVAVEDNVGKVKQKLEETNYTASLKTLMEASGCKRTSVQKMVKNQLQLKSLTKEKMRRVTSTHAERRLAACFC